MGFPLNAKIAAGIFVCATCFAPVMSSAQSFDTAPSGSFSFDVFGPASAEALPVEIATESNDAVAATPTTVASVQPVVAPNGVATTRVTSRRIQNTWSIGVFR